MTDQSIRTALVGCGYWGPNLARNIAANSAMSLAAICDQSAAVRDEFAKRYPEAAVFDTTESLLADETIDAVVLATPSGLHYQQALETLEAGKHVMVEKPLSHTVAEASELIDAAASRDRILMVGHTFLYNNIVQDVKTRIDSGELGDVLYAYAQRLNLGRFRQDSDVVWTLAPHDISILNYWFDALPEQVSARGSAFIHRRTDIAEVAFCQIDYPNDRIAHLHLSWLDPQKRREMVVVGSDKMLVYDDANSDRHIQIYDKSVAVDFQGESTDFADFSTRLRAGDLVVPNIRLREPLAVEIEAFASAIRSGMPPPTDGRHGLAVVAVLEAISASMRKDGKVIEVKYP
tara:strand:- start:201 stop:1241 length:1041 start_codon:yes stop_codon:yes gene_type:complete